ncbi:YecA family protein [Chloroflexota bacterium]
MVKIGRNDQCPCGSGKKYKFCCIGKPEPPAISKHYYRLKGKTAEEFVHGLAKETFFTDWCYLNPRLPNGRELCDLLVVFDDVAIIWQIKNLTVDKDGHYNESEIQKNLRQLSGARRQLFELNTSIELDNPRRGKELFNPNDIRKVHLVSVLLGEGEGVFPFMELIKNYDVHMFEGPFTEIVLNELDTITDFTDYLHAKEDVIKQNDKMVIIGGEEELLATYLLNERSFMIFDGSTHIMIDQGIWEDIQSKPEYIRKKKEDEISYGWDSMINRAHECSGEYEKVARELARSSRFRRRVLAKAFYEAHVKAHEVSLIPHEAGEHPVYRHMSHEDSREGITYCFLFQEPTESPTMRREHLIKMCWIARCMVEKNTKVLGIATEIRIEPQCSYDFGLLDVPALTDADRKYIDDIQKKTGIFTNLNIRHVSEDEYPLTDQT